MNKNNQRDLFSKQDFFIILLSFRKLLKNQANKHGNGLLFSRIPLLVFKYEVLPNLCYSNTLKKYLVYQISSQTIHSFSLTTFKLENLENIAPYTLGHKGWITQVNNKEFATYSEEKFYYYQMTQKKYQVERYETISPKYYHPMIYNNKHLIYILSKPTETFNIKQQKMSLVAELPDRSANSGCCFVNKTTLYVAGGYSDQYSMSS